MTVATYPAVIDAAMLIGGDAAAGAAWTITVASAAPGLTTGTHLAGPGQTSTGRLDDDGAATVHLAESPVGSWYQLDIAGFGVWRFQMPAAPANVAVEAAKFGPVAPVGPTPGPPGPPGLPGAYSWWQHRRMNVTAVSSRTPVQREYRQTLVDDTFPGGLAAGVPFVTSYEGAITFDGDGGTYLVGIRNVHHLTGGIEFSALRSLRVIERAGGVSIPLAAFSSVSMVELGSYTAPDGTTIDITADMLAAESRITVELSIERADGRAWGLTLLDGQLTEVTWSQTGFATEALAAGPPGADGATGPYYVRLWAATAGDDPPATAPSASVVPSTGATVPVDPWAATPPAVPDDGTLWTSIAHITDTRSTTPVTPAFSTPFAASGEHGGPPGPAGRGIRTVTYRAPSLSLTLTDGTVEGPFDIAADTAALDDQIAGLELATADLVAGAPSTGWSDTTASAQGGITQTQAEPTTAAAAAALSGWAQSRVATFGYHAVARVPTTASPEQYRVSFAGQEGTFFDPVTHWRDLGVVAPWRYYASAGALAGEQTLTLQATSDAAHVGTSRFVGELDEAQAADAVAGLLTDGTGGDIDFGLDGSAPSRTLSGLLRRAVVDQAALADDVKDVLLPELPPAGSRDGKGPFFDGDDLAWSTPAAGVELSDSDPQPPGPPVPGAGTKASRDDHVHRAPNWGEVSGKPDRIGAFTAADEAKLDSLDADRQLPALPAAGSRDGKSPVFSGDALGWERVAGPLSTTQIGSSQTLSGSVASTVTLADLPETFLVHVVAGSDQASEIIRKDLIDTAGDRVDVQYGHTGSDAVRLWNSSGTLRLTSSESLTVSFWRFGAAGSSGPEAPTLAQITSALGLSAVDPANRGMLVVRHAGDEQGYDYIAPAAVGWLRSKADFVAKIRAIRDGYSFAVNAGRDEVDFVGPDTTSPWPTPTKLDDYTAISAPNAGSDIMEIETGLDPALRKISAADLKAWMLTGVSGHIGAGPGIVVSPNDIISIRPPNLVAGFWGNAQEGTPDLEVMRYRDLVVDDERNSTGVDISWPYGWGLDGQAPPRNGIRMQNDQEHTLDPASNTTQPNDPTGTPPPGIGKWSFGDRIDGRTVGSLRWTGRWPANGMDLKVQIDMSDFQVNDRIHLTLTTNNDDLWGSARTPDRGVDFGGAGDSITHTHTHVYELRPTSITDGTTITIQLEAIKQGNPSGAVPVGLFRGARVTLTYVPTSPTVAHQVFSLGVPTRNTSIDAIGSDAWLIPVTYSADADHTGENHIDVDSGDTVWEHTRGLNNVLMELLSHGDTTVAAWFFELWTYAPGTLDWHMARRYAMPGPTSGTSASQPAVHLYFDSGAVLDGQQFVMAARGLSRAPTVAAMGSMTIDLDTNFDERFPRRTVLAHGLITTEQIVATAEGSLSSSARTWAAPAARVLEWETVHVLVADRNGAQHTAAFDVRGWRRLDETKQMNTMVRSQPQLGADQTLSRGSDGRLTYQAGDASVQVLEAFVDLER